MVDCIKALCRERGLTIASLERKANIGNGTICRWDQYSPTFDSLVKVAGALEMTVPALVEAIGYGS